MAVSLFLYYSGQTGDRELFRSAYCRGPGAILKDLPSVRSVEVYTPVKVAGLLDEDDEAPLAVVQTRFDSLLAAEKALGSATFTSALEAFEAVPAGKWHLRYEAMRGETYAGGGETDPLTTAVPLAYLARYERPAEDEVAFIEHYCAIQIPAMAALPGVRRIEVYTPLGWTDALPVARADHMVVSDAGFASLDALDAALLAETRLMVEDEAPPRFAGRETHLAMQRTRLLPG